MLSIRSLTTLIAVVLLFSLSACTQEATTVAPVELKPGTACSLDGMLLLDYPGPKAQIHYANGDIDFFCDTMEMFSIYLNPETQTRVTAIYTQDMAQEDWKTPRSHWIDARSAFYVQGSKMKGAMGPTFASFARKEDADAFAKEHGGKVLRFDQVDADASDLTGGAAHDQGM
jgi:copper chaperone NosL